MCSMEENSDLCSKWAYVIFAQIENTFFYLKSEKK